VYTSGRVVINKNMNSFNNTTAVMIMRRTWRKVCDAICFVNILDLAKSAVCIAAMSCVLPVNLVSVSHVIECDERYVRYYNHTNILGILRPCFEHLSNCLF
jgi:hypothetical protein